RWDHRAIAARQIQFVPVQRFSSLNQNINLEQAAVSVTFRLLTHIRKLSRLSKTPSVLSG
ncbi:hypothetical protein, partial [Providencia stuartii]|uniref:hypothetical protein n=1 Tax=Providencia stuartii TaxID=588 RepID=UPI00197EE0F3